MANNYFQFKQFRVEQSRSAMKVGTDGVLIGAWSRIGCGSIKYNDSTIYDGGEICGVASEVCGVDSEVCGVDGAVRVLDIGCGTGLIALMIAQRFQNACIDAIDIDPGACQDAVENAVRSPWSDRIRVFNQSLQQFARMQMENGTKYDAVVTNPPYFVDSLQSEHRERTVARHAVELDSRQILINTLPLLSDHGILSLILPTSLAEDFMICASGYGLIPTRVCEVFPTPESQVKRLMLELSKNSSRDASAVAREKIVIETNGRHNFSQEYIELTKEFYLKL